MKFKYINKKRKRIIDKIKISKNVNVKILNNNKKLEKDEYKNNNNNLNKLKNLSYNIILNQKEKNIKINSKNLIEKLNTFNNIPNLNKNLLNNINSNNYNYLTNIQKIVFSLIFNNSNNFNENDFLIISQTGTGKTLCYLIPIINILLSTKNETKFLKNIKIYPISLIILPTRELVNQIYEESIKLSNNLNINIVKIFGGNNYDNEILNMSRGCDILITTPGRLIEYLKTNILSLKYLKFFVLDEFDKIIEMGFIQQLNEIIFDYDLINKNQRKNLFLSATYKKNNIIFKYLKNFYLIQNLNKEIKYLNINQKFIECENSDEKFNELYEIINSKIEKNNNIKILIFCNSIENTEKLYHKIINLNKNIKINYFNGNLSQKNRKIILNKFENNNYNILICTDILGRGIDTIINLVINYDIPNKIEEYIHRIGRTGRIGKEGNSIMLFDKEIIFKNNLNYKKILNELINFLQSKNLKIPEFINDYINIIN